MKRNTLLIIVYCLATTIGFAQTQTQTQTTNPTQPVNQPANPAAATSTSATSAAARPAANNIGIEIAPVNDQTFTGMPVTPEPVIKYGNITLKKDVDYVLSYANNVNVGAATLTITGKGNYNDAKTITFRIVPKSIGAASGGTPKK